MSYVRVFPPTGDQTYLVSAVFFILALPLLGMLVFYCRIARVSAKSTRAISKHGGVLVVKLRRRDRRLNQVRTVLRTAHAHGYATNVHLFLHTYLHLHTEPISRSLNAGFGAFGAQSPSEFTIHSSIHRHQSISHELLNSCT